MNIKKILIFNLLMIHTIIQPYNWNDEDFQNLAGTGIIITTATVLTYLWATSGATVEQRIKDAEQDLETMPEYEQKFDTTILLEKKEAQIKKILQQLNIDINNLDKRSNQKLHNDLVTIQATYNNLWFKSFYGGKEIAELTPAEFIKLKLK